MVESLAEPFWNERSRRPRLPWRLLAFVLVLALVGLVLGLIAFAVFGALEPLLAQVLPGEGARLLVADVGQIVVQSAVILGAVVLSARYVDRRRIRDLGLRVDGAWWLDLVFGLGLGAALVGGLFLIELAAGWIVLAGTLEGGAGTSWFWPAIATSVLFWIAVGVYEELLTRGYLLTNLAEGFTWFDGLDDEVAVGLAAVVTSLLFALLHAANPNASLASTTGIFLAGLMLAAGYVLTGELAVPIGIHVSWNLFQGTVFGFPVSGVDQAVSILAIEQRGPAWLTGGEFGPEAGVLGVGATVVGIALVGAWARYRDGHLHVARSITTPDLLTADGRE